MYLLTRDYSGGDDKWLVGLYDDQGKWVDAPLVAGHTTPSYDFHTASDHLMNMNADLERKNAEINKVDGDEEKKQKEDSTSNIAKILLMLFLLIFLSIILLRVLAAVFMILFPLLVLFAVIAIVLYFFGEMF